MAAVKNKESGRLADFIKGSEGSDTAGENTSQDSGLRARLDMALHDLETAHANLDLERQRVSIVWRTLVFCVISRAQSSFSPQQDRGPAAGT